MNKKDNKYMKKIQNSEIDPLYSRKLLMLDIGITMHQYIHRKLIKRLNPNSLLRFFNLSALEQINFTKLPKWMTEHETQGKLSAKIQMLIWNAIY